MAEKIEVVIVDESAGQSQPSPPGSPTTPPQPNRPSQPTTPPPAQPGQPATPGNGGSWINQIINAIRQGTAQSAAIQRLIQGTQQSIQRIVQLPGQLLRSAANLIPASFRQAGSALGQRMTGGAQRAASTIWDKIAAKQRAQIISLLKALVIAQGGNVPRMFRPKALNDFLGRQRLPTVAPRQLQNIKGTAARVAEDAAIGRAASGATGAAAGRATAGAATSGAGGAITGALSNPVTAVIAAVVVGLTALALATVGLVKVFKSQEQELAEVSGEISGALAEREMARIESRIERNERFGSDIAQFSRTWTNFEEAVYQLWTEILDLLMPFLPAIESIIEMLTVMVQAFRKQLAAVNVIVELLDFTGKTEETPMEAIKNYLDATADYNRAVQDFLTASGPGSKGARMFGQNPFKDESYIPRPAQFNPPLPPRPGGGP